MIKIRPYQKKGRAIQKDKWEVDIVVRLPSGEVKRERVKSPVGSISGTRRWAAEREGVLLSAPSSKSTDMPSKEGKAPTFEVFAPRFIDGYARANLQKPSSIASKQTHLGVHILPRFGKKRLDELTNEDVQQFKAALGNKSAKTINNVLSTLSMLLKIAVEWGVIAVVPARLRMLKVSPSKYDFYEFETYDRLVAAAAKIEWRIHALILLGGDAGLRRGEIIALEWSDIDLHRQQVTVNRSEWAGHVTLPKGGRIRHVPMTQRLAEVLRANRHLQGERVIYRDDGEGLTAKVARKWVERAQRRAGLAVNGRMHNLRHTFCSHLAMRGAPAVAIKELAGHTSLTTTMRYMHLSPSEKDRAIGLLDQRHAEVAEVVAGTKEESG